MSAWPWIAAAVIAWALAWSGIKREEFAHAERIAKTACEHPLASTEE